MLVYVLNKVEEEKDLLSHAELDITLQYYDRIYHDTISHIYLKEEHVGRNMTAGIKTITITITTIIMIIIMIISLLGNAYLAVCIKFNNQG